MACGSVGGACPVLHLPGVCTARILAAGLIAYEAYGVYTVHYKKQPFNNVLFSPITSAWDFGSYEKHVTCVMEMMLAIHIIFFMMPRMVLGVAVQALVHAAFAAASLGSLGIIISGNHAKKGAAFTVPSLTPCKECDATWIAVLNLFVAIFFWNWCSDLERGVVASSEAVAYHSGNFKWPEFTPANSPFFSRESSVASEAKPAKKAASKRSVSKKRK